MDKDHVVKLMANGILQEITEEAMGMIREASTADGMKFKDTAWELMEAGASMGVAAALNWLHRNNFLKEMRLP